MKKMLLPFLTIFLLGSACEKQSLAPENNLSPGVTNKQLSASPKEVDEVRSLEGILNKEASIIFTSKRNRPAPGLQEIDWKVDYKGEKELDEITYSHSLLVDYIIDLQDFLEQYPVQKYFFLGVHREFITKLQLALALKQGLETGIEKLINADVETARFQMLRRVFEDMDRELEERGMIFQETEDSLEPILSIGRRKKKAKRLARALRQYIKDGEELLQEANIEFSKLELGKIKIAKIVLKKINEAIN